MTDRELLERAARAGGYQWRADIAASRQEGGILGLWVPGVSTRWNPLEDDGDALRLAVKLQLTVANEQLRAGAAYCTNADEEAFPSVWCLSANEGLGPDDYAATRRAIVLAAAELAKL
jgi:hypothetical protein